MKISSLLIESPEALVEHLGNLDKIDKELVKILSSSFKSKGQTQRIGFKKKEKQPDKDVRDQLKNVAQPGFYKSEESHHDVWDSGTPRVTNKLFRVIGQNSPLHEKQLSVAEAQQALLDDTQTAAIVYKLDGKQVMIIKHDLLASKKLNALSKKAAYGESSSWSWKMTKTFVRKLFDEHPQKYPPATSKKTVLTELSALLKIQRNVAEGTITSKKTIELLFKTLAIYQWLRENAEAKSMLKEADLPKLDVILIGIDEQRGSLSGQRKETRSNSVPVPKTPVQEKMPGVKYLATSHDVYIRGLANHLMYRLNQHKNKKSAAFETPAEMLEHFLKEGYLKKLVFMNEPYNLTSNSIDFDDLMLGPKGKSKSKSYIEYSSEAGYAWRDPKIHAAEAEFKELVKDMGVHAPAPVGWWKTKLENATTDDDRVTAVKEWQDDWAREALKPKLAEIYAKHKAVPTKIKVLLVLDGGKIVPHKFEMNYGI